MSQLTESLASNLNLRINYLHDILKISHKGEQFELLVNKKGDTRVELFDFVISTLPAGVLSDAIVDIDNSLAETLDKVEYAPLTQVYVSYLKQDLEISTKGYTVLIPAIENREVLNITHVSGLFEGRCPGDRHLFSVMMGGNRNGDLTAIDQKEINKKAIATLSEIFKAKDKPVFVTAKSWKKGVPQYGGEYFQLKDKIEKFEKENSGIFISGNFSGGVSIGDSILNAYKTSERVARFIQQN
jgi:oxygen-dependent protoporphyrinogen oxidase